MFSGDRPDGTVVRNAPRMRLFMPFIIPRRSDAVVAMMQKIDVTETQAYLKRWNDGTRPKLRLNHIYVAACARMLAERPRVNRFIVGRRLYQRNEIAISMAILGGRNENAEARTVKQIYQPEDGLTAVRARTEEFISLGRAAEKSVAEREVALLSRLPRWLTPIVMKVPRLLDWFNLTPAAMIRSDPLNASMMMSFNGTIGIDSLYHHLYEHGTVSIFSTLGPVRYEPVVNKDREIEVRPVITARYTGDERITDGHYYSRALILIKTLVESPWLLETPDDNGPGAP